MNGLGSELQTSVYLAEDNVTECELLVQLCSHSDKWVIHMNSYRTHFSLL